MLLYDHVCHWVHHKHLFLLCMLSSSFLLCSEEDRTRSSIVFPAICHSNPNIYCHVGGPFSRELCVISTDALAKYIFTLGLFSMLTGSSASWRAPGWNREWSVYFAHFLFVALNESLFLENTSDNVDSRNCSETGRALWGWKWPEQSEFWYAKEVRAASLSFPRPVIFSKIGEDRTRSLTNTMSPKQLKCTVESL